MTTEMLQKIWPEWQIEGKPLGKGSFGVVYKAARRDHNVESFAAIKAISIPADPSEVDSLRSEGLDMDGTRTYLQGIVNDFVSEIQLMESLKGVQNIVSVEDYKVVEKTGEIGWDIYIRMELLTSFNNYICDKKLTEEEVIKLGCDICTALEICAKRNIIHRDIKPENIFINDFGYFKLGDFGIARKMENLTGGLSQKGTFNYMAPEVVNSGEYDARVDIYSLGIVLYRLLNGNRLPFLDTEKQLLNPNERRNAVDRRIRGEELPAPCDASPAMADLILRACAFDPAARFASATEMKQALMSVSNGTYKIGIASDLDRTTAVRRAPADYDKTISVREAPKAANQKTGQAVNTFGAASKKDNLPKIIAAVLAVVVLVGAGIFAVPRLFDRDGTETNTEPNEGNASETADYSRFDREQIASIISEADALADEEDYEGALIKIQTGLATYSKSEELQSKSEEYTYALNAQVKADALTAADMSAQAGDYLGAFNTVNQAMASIGDDKELAGKAAEYEDAYASNVVSQVDTYLGMGDVDAAEQLVSGALNHFPENAVIKEQQIRIENSNLLSAERYTGSYEDYKKKHFNSAEASSEIRRDGMNFSVSHVIDGTAKTCWQENGEGIGAGEWVKLYFEENTGVDVLKLRLGYGEDHVNYLNNSRPSELKIEFSDGQSITWDFPDVNEDYALKLSETVYTDWVMLTIIDAYDGKIWPDTSIAEVTAYAYGNPNGKPAADERNSPAYANESETWGYATLASSDGKSVEALVLRELTENGRWSEYFDGTSSDVWLKEYPDKSCRVRQTTTMTTGREFEIFITNNANAYRSRTGGYPDLTDYDMAIEEYSYNIFDHMYSELNWLDGEPLLDGYPAEINGNSWHIYSGYSSGSGTQDFFWVFFFIDESRELAVEVSFEYVLYKGATLEDAAFFDEWYLNLRESLLIS